MTLSPKMIGAGIAAFILATLAFTPANAEVQTPTLNHDAAINACSTVNPFQPVEVVNAVADGSGEGFSLVWLKDKDGYFWMCDADSKGNVYSYSFVDKDLLNGGGPELIGLQLASDGTSAAEPQVIAERVCAAYITDGTAMLSTPDGLSEDPGFIVFVKDSSEATYLCNATGNAAVWAFEPLGDPLSFGEPEVS